MKVISNIRLAPKVNVSGCTKKLQFALATAGRTPVHIRATDTGHKARMPGVKTDAPLRRETARSGRFEPRKLGL